MIIIDEMVKNVSKRPYIFQNGQTYKLFFRFHVDGLMVWTEGLVGTSWDKAATKLVYINTETDCM